MGCFYSSRQPSRIGPTADFNDASIPFPRFSTAPTVLSSSELLLLEIMQVCGNPGGIINTHPVKIGLTNSQIIEGWHIPPPLSAPTVLSSSELLLLEIMQVRGNQFLSLLANCVKIDRMHFKVVAIPLGSCTAWPA